MNGQYVCDTGCFSQLQENQITYDTGKINDREVIE